MTVPSKILITLLLAFLLERLVASIIGFDVLLALPILLIFCPFVRYKDLLLYVLVVAIPLDILDYNLFGLHTFLFLSGLSISYLFSTMYRGRKYLYIGICLAICTIVSTTYSYMVAYSVNLYQIVPSYFIILFGFIYISNLNLNSKLFFGYKLPS